MLNNDYVDDDDNNDEISYTHDYITYGASVLAPAIVRFGFWSYEICASILQSKLVTTLGFRAFWLYCSTMVYLENKWNYYYNTYDTIRNGVDRFTETMNFVLGNRISIPDSKNWSQVCMDVQFNKYDSVHYYESSHLLDDNLSPKDAITHFKNVFESIQEADDAMILMKYQDLYRIKWYCKLFKNNIDVEENLKISSFKPISITCKCEKVEKPIEIEIPDSMWCVGNELFTPVFIHRCIKHQGIPYVHSAEYVIEIIDENVNIHQIKNGEYIEVCQDSIIVHTIQNGPPELISLDDEEEVEASNEEEVEASNEEEVEASNEEEVEEVEVSKKEEEIEVVEASNEEEEAEAEEEEVETEEVEVEVEVEAEEEEVEDGRG